MAGELGTAGEHAVNGMNPFFREVDRLEEDLRPLARTLGARGRRFFALFLPAFLTALVTSRTLTWGTVAALAFSTVMAVLVDLDPAIPWSTLAARFDVARWRDPVVTSTVKRPGP